MLAYTAVSYWRLRSRVKEAVLLRDNIYQSENVVSPFVLGIFKPRIYLPYAMAEQDMHHVVAHEKAHIRRKDHWWKPLGFLLLTLHWFNPIMWLAYILLCRDIELACDEKVIKELGAEQRADYSQALLSCSVNRRMIAACPLAFGEVGVKERVKKVLNYRKPAFWLIVIAIIACVVAAVCFLTDPKEKEDPAATDASTDQTEPSATPARPDNSGGQLTLSDVIALSAKGMELTWEDLAAYSCEDVGASLYICRYEIDPEYYLSVEDVKLSGTPVHVVLYSVSTGDCIDIRQSDVAAFIEAQREAAARLAMGTYIPVRCAYMNPLSSYLPVDPSGDWRYIVTEDSFIKEYLNSGGTSEITSIDWQWKTRDEAKSDMKFLDETFFGLMLNDDCLYQKLGVGYHIIKDRDTLYLINGGGTGTELKSVWGIDESIWSIYVLVPEGSAEARITELLNTIELSPAYRSDPGAYIDAHPEEYDELISYGTYTLRYCFGQFLQGGQTDLRGHIMAIACEDIMSDWKEGYNIDPADRETGQEWFDSFLRIVREMQNQKDENGMTPYYPGAALVLEMAD